MYRFPLDQEDEPEVSENPKPEVPLSSKFSNLLQLLEQRPKMEKNEKDKNFIFLLKLLK